MTDKLKISYKSQINILGFILIAMAGWVDAVGINLFAKESGSFMTGKGRNLASLAFKGDFRTFFIIIIVIISFIIGAFISTLITKNFGLTGGLFFSGGLIILAVILMNIVKFTIATIVIPMAMGGQNAATSLTEIKRTTHLTGAATDIGINLAKGNWEESKFWIFRWIGFPLGAYFGLKSVHFVNIGRINNYIPLIIPAFIIIITGVIQKFLFDIPLLDEIK